MNIDNGFELLVTVVFTMSPQLGGLGPKSKDLVKLFRLERREYLSQSHLKYLQSICKIYPLNDETRQTNNLTGKNIMEL